MPGLNFVFKEEGINLDYDNIGDILKYDENYFYKTIISNKNIYLSYSGYKEYPLFEFMYKNFKIIVEGMIYNYSTRYLQKELLSIVESFILKGNFKTKIQEFIKKADGDYVICIIDIKSNDYIIFNDKYGRLPCYYYLNNKYRVISRDINFVLKYIQNKKINKNAIIEWLLFTYFLGEKTFFKDIFKTLTSCLFYRCNGKDIIDKLFEPNFNFDYHQIKGEEYYLEVLKELFLESCKNKVQKIESSQYNSIVDISGGFDTRTVLAGIKKFNSNAIGVTLSLITGDESEYAIKIANIFNTELVKICVNNIRITDSKSMEKAKRIANMINGLEPIYEAYSNFLLSKQIRNRFPINYVHYGGFGGEYIRHPYKLKKWQKNIRDFLRNWREDIKLVSHMVNNADEKEIYDYLESEIKNICKSTDLHSLIRCLYFNYYNGLVLSGEERARIHFWTVQPLISIRLMDFYTSGFPLEFASYANFIKFMISIDRRIALVPTTHFKELSPNLVTRYPIKEKVKNVLRDFKFMDYFLDLPFSGRILAQMKIYSKNPYNLSNDEINLMNFKIIEKFNDSVMLRKYFKIGALENVLKNPVTFRFNEKLLTIGLLFNEMDWGI